MAGSLWNRLTRNGRRLELWRSALAQHGLKEEESSRFPRARLTARSGSVAVRITGARQENGIVVEVEGPEGFSVLKLRRETLHLFQREIEVGDQAFDGTFFIEAPLAAAYGLLDASTRDQLTETNAGCGSFEIGDGRLRVEIAEEGLPDVLPRLLDLGRRFADLRNPERRIARNARRDPKSRVRLLNLQLLARECPGTPETLGVLRDACSDPNSAVRLRAAIELGAEGRDLLLTLAESSKDDAISSQAIAHLGGELPLELARKILSHALRKGQGQTARACLEALGHHGAAVVGLLARVLAERKGELAVAAAAALATTGEETAEPPLLQALQSEDDDLRKAAVAALGRVGTAAAVQPLKEAAERSWTEIGLRRAARQAVAEIQSRLAGAAPGQLSLADAEAGQLSLAAEAAGRLTLRGGRNA
ncbi:MAG TPA: hypothetical protein DD490_30730 [Acidobacteria bacterium]|nr:hypothetical protein [Acidobacteriota bacterium]